MSAGRAEDAPPTDRFVEAVAYARRLHREQVRKGSSAPYVSHLLGVASLVLEHGGSEDQAIAALLHDALEDHGTPEVAAHIRTRFGEPVLRIVQACSDVLQKPPPGEPKPPWRLRKEEYLAHLRVVSPRARLVSAADKLHNARAIVTDVHGGDPGEVWGRFTGGQEGTLWYYRALARAFRTLELEPAAPSLVGALERTVAEMGRLPSV